MKTERRVADDRIARDADVMVGKPVVKGTRVPVELVLRQLAQSLDLRDVLEAFPHLTTEDVRACLTYAAGSLEAEARRTQPGVPAAPHIASG